MKGGFAIEPLASHDRDGFSCGVPALDRYLREQASQDAKRLMSSCFVAVEPGAGKIAGYYTLAATSVLAGDLPPETIKRLPRYPAIPAALIGRLAVDGNFKGIGLGGALIADAALRVLKGAAKAFALIVDAKDDPAAAFYRHHGFLPLQSKPMSLFLAVATAAKAMECAPFSP